VNTILHRRCRRGGCRKSAGHRVGPPPAPGRSRRLSPGWATGVPGRTVAHRQRRPRLIRLKRIVIRIATACPVEIRRQRVRQSWARARPEADVLSQARRWRLVSAYNNHETGSPAMVSITGFSIWLGKRLGVLAGEITLRRKKRLAAANVPASSRRSGAELDRSALSSRRTKTIEERRANGDRGWWRARCPPRASVRAHRRRPQAQTRGCDRPRKRPQPRVWVRAALVEPSRHAVRGSRAVSRHQQGQDPLDHSRPALSQGPAQRAHRST